MRARVLIAVIAVVAACSGADERDASQLDAGLDAARDAGGDGGHDGGHDANDDDARGSRHDARVPSLAADDPGWTAIPGFPSDCLQYARQPQAVLQFHWAPCGDGLPACTWIVVDHATATVRNLFTSGRSDSRGVVFWTLDDGATPGQEIIVVVRDDAPQWAWRQPIRTAEQCFVIPTGSTTAIGADALYWFSAARRDDFIGLASWTDLTPLVSGLWQLPSGAISATDLAQSPSASATTFALDTTNAILVVEPPRWMRFSPGESDTPVVIGHEVLFDWSGVTSGSAIHAASLDGGERTLFSEVDGRHVFAVQADATSIVWRAGADDPTGMTFPLNELWTAPFETDPARFSPRVVRSDLPQCGLATCGAIGGGMYAEAGSDYVRAISLADGSQRRYPFPPRSADGTFWFFSGNPIWVSPDEVVTFGGRRVNFDPPALAAIRIDLRALPVEPAP